MNTLLDTPKKVDYSAPNLVIEMASGIVLSFPVNDNPRLAKGSPAQLRNVEVSPLGLHWPDLDEDLSFEGLLRGDFGSRATQNLMLKNLKLHSPIGIGWV